ncbi:chromosome condensation protein [Parafrankia sp. FMc2]|uniref:chromosome condensation protein n=1 Tax=Parafrankia sp. FMc2 TaxID=3233196 RepID=UPI0034D67BDE
MDVLAEQGRTGAARPARMTMGVGNRRSPQPQRGEIGAPAGHPHHGGELNGHESNTRESKRHASPGRIRGPGGGAGDGDGGGRAAVRAAARPGGGDAAAAWRPKAGRRRALTLDEALIVASDRKRSPLTVGVIAETDAAIHPVGLRHSLERALRDHPIARARLAGGVGTPSSWDFSADPDMTSDLIYEIHTASLDEAGAERAIWRAVESLCSRPFDLRALPPIRLLLAHRPAGDVVGLVAHHVALDGMSVLTLLQEIVAGCAADHTIPDVVGGRAPQRSAAPRQRLANERQQPAAPLQRYCQAGPSRRPPAQATDAGAPLGAGAATTGPPIRRRAVPHLAPCGPSHAQGYGVHPVDLPVPPPMPLADGRRMTVNDLLIAAAHLAVERWNAENGRPSGRVLVRMPIARRPPDPEGARELGNRSGQVMISSSAAERTVPGLLAAAVVEQTLAAKRNPTGWAGDGLTVAVRTVMTAVPRSLRTTVLRCVAAMARPFLAPSVAVSNISRVDGLRFAPEGTVRITGLSFIGTTGMPQGLLICVAGNGDRLRLTFCHHRRLFDPAGMARFVEIFQESLTGLITTLRPESS